MIGSINAPFIFRAKFKVREKSSIIGMDSIRQVRVLIETSFSSCIIEVSEGYRCKYVHTWDRVSN